MATVFGIDHRYIAVSALAVTTGVAVYSVYKLRKEGDKEKKSNVYESEKLLNEYMVFHYGLPHEVLKYDFGPKDALDFAKRCGEVCLSYFNEDQADVSRALDIGCAVGRSSFEMARRFKQVVGIDFSHSFIDACNRLKRDGMKNYWIINEGELTTNLTATIDSSIDRSRLTFEQGDACNLPASLGQFNCVLAANLICRLPEPIKFLHRLSSLVTKGGYVVITSPYSIMEEFTPKDKWFGGYFNTEGQAVTGFDTLKGTLGEQFDLVDEHDMSFFIRETARKNQWTVAHLTVWRKK